MPDRKALLRESIVIISYFELVCWVRVKGFNVKCCLGLKFRLLFEYFTCLTLLFRGSTKLL